MWSGVDTTTANDATTTTATGIDSSVPNPPSITTVTDNALVIAVGSGSQNDSTITAPSGYSNQTQADNTTGGNQTTAMASLTKTPAGAEDPAAWTNWTTSTSDSWTAATVALRPTAAPADTLFAQSVM